MLVKVSSGDESRMVGACLTMVNGRLRRMYGEELAGLVGGLAQSECGRGEVGLLFSFPKRDWSWTRSCCGCCPW